MTSFKGLSIEAVDNQKGTARTTAELSLLSEANSVGRAERFYVHESFILSKQIRIPIFLLPFAYLSFGRVHVHVNVFRGQRDGHIQEGFGGLW